MDFSQKAVRAVLRTYLEDGYLDGSCLPLAAAMWRQPLLAMQLLRCRAVPLHGRYPALYGLLVALLQQHGAAAVGNMDTLLTACCRIRPLTVYELRQLPLFLQAAGAVCGVKVPSFDAAAAEERHSIAERLLAEEPSGIYPHLSAEGRAECRELVARQVQWQNSSETAVAAAVSAQAFRDGTHAAALLLAAYQQRQDAVARVLRTAALCLAAIGSVPLCVAADAPWALLLVWGGLCVITLPLARFVLRLLLPPCRHLPFGRIPPSASRRPVARRENDRIHPDMPQATLLTGGDLALLLTDNGAGRIFYRRRALTPPESDPLLHPAGLFFSVSGDVRASLTAAPYYRVTAAYTTQLEERCVRYRYRGAALDSTVTVSVHPGGYGAIYAVRLHNRTPQTLQLTLHTTLPFVGTCTPDARCGLLLIRGRQGQPPVGVGFAEAVDTGIYGSTLSAVLTLETDQALTLNLLVAVGVSREAVRCAFGALRENTALMPDAGAPCALPPHFVERVLPHLIGPPEGGKAAARALQQITESSAALRRFGLRPSLPFLLLSAHNPGDVARCMPFLQGVTALHRAGLLCGAVVLTPDTTTLEAVHRAIRHSECAALCGRHGSLRVLCTPSEEDRRLLTACCAYDATHENELGTLRTAFSPLFFTDGALFVRVGNAVRKSGRVGPLRVSAQGHTLLLRNPTVKAVRAEVALLIPHVGQTARLECDGTYACLHDGNRRIALSEADGLQAFFCRRTAFYEGAWTGEPLPCPHPCAVVLCPRTVEPGDTVAIRLRMRITSS